MYQVSVVISFIASVMIFFVVIFVLVKNWREQVMRYFALFTGSALGILFTMFLTYAFPDTLDLTQINKITQCATLMTFASLLILSFVFPKTEKPFPFYLALLVLLPAMAAGTAIVFTDITITRAYFSGGKFLRDYNRVFPGYTIYSVMVFLYLLTAAGNFIRRYIKTKVAIYRLQMRYLFVGSSFSMILAAFFSIIMPLAFNYSEMYVIGPSIASFFTIFSLFYSIIAYHLLDIRTVIHKTFVYAVISMVIIVPIMGILWAYERGLGGVGDVPPVIVAGSVVGVFILFSLYVQPAIDRLFKRRQYAFGAVVDAFIRDIAGVRDLNEVVRRTVDVIRDGLSLRRAFFILLNDETRRFELFYLGGDDKGFFFTPLELNSSIIRWFIRNQDVLELSRVYTDERSFADIRDDIAGFFNEYGVQVILPVYYEWRLVGLLCLGTKETLAGYHSDEMEKLRHFHPRCNDFIATALTYQRAMKEQMVSRAFELSARLLACAVPDTLPNLNTIKFGAFVIPKYTKGCDYFDFIRLGEHGVGVLATDISGVGVASAIPAVILHTAFHAGAADIASPSTVMGNLNRALMEYGSGGMITAYCFYFDSKTMRLAYSNAGYPALELFRIRKNNFDTLDTEGVPLGYDTGSGYGTGRTDLERGDIGVLYSRTLTGSKNIKGEEFGLLRLRSIVMENRVRSAAYLAQQIRDAFDSFMGISKPQSDVVVIAFKIV